MRLIDADELEKELEKTIADYEKRMPNWSSNDYLTSGKDAAYKWGGRADGVDDALEMVKYAPTIEAEAANVKAACMSKAHTIMQHYGAEAQKDILIEECAELIQAVEKTRRLQDKPDFTADMVEEMADVQIMLWQFISLMNGYWKEHYEHEIGRKLRRQIERIENELGHEHKA